MADGKCQREPLYDQTGPDRFSKRRNEIWLRCNPVFFSEFTSRTRLLLYIGTDLRFGLFFVEYAMADFSVPFDSR